MNGAVTGGALLLFGVGRGFHEGESIFFSKIDISFSL